MMLGAVSDWLKKHWRRGDFQVVPLVTYSNAPDCSEKVTLEPKAKAKKSLKAVKVAAQRTRLAPVESKRPKR